MTNEEIIARQRAHREHMAAVPHALEIARLAVLNAYAPRHDESTPRSILKCRHVITLVAEIDRLQALVKRQQKDAAEEQREFQREARDIAAEARWQALEETRDGGY